MIPGDIAKFVLVLDNRRLARQSPPYCASIIHLSSQYPPTNRCIWMSVSVPFQQHPPHYSLVTCGEIGLPTILKFLRP